MFIFLHAPSWNCLPQAELVGVRYIVDTTDTQSLPLDTGHVARPFLVAVVEILADEVHGASLLHVGLAGLVARC